MELVVVVGAVLLVVVAACVVAVVVAVVAVVAVVVLVVLVAVLVVSVTVVVVVVVDVAGRPAAWTVWPSSRNATRAMERLSVPIRARMLPLSPRSIATIARSSSSLTD
jgi:hypothetical protein